MHIVLLLAFVGLVLASSNPHPPGGYFIGRPANNDTVQQQQPAVPVPQQAPVANPEGQVGVPQHVPPTPQTTPMDPEARVAKHDEDQVFGPPTSPYLLHHYIEPTNTGISGQVGGDNTVGDSGQVADSAMSKEKVKQASEPFADFPGRF